MKNLYLYSFAVIILLVLCIYDAEAREMPNTSRATIITHERKQVGDKIVRSRASQTARGRRGRR